MGRTANGKVPLHLTTRTVMCERQNIPVEKADLNLENMRTFSWRGKERLTQKAAKEHILMHHRTSDLIRSITQFGVLDPILVRQKNGRFAVMEGDRRTTAVDSLNKTSDTAGQFPTIPALILPDDVTDHEINRYLAHVHVDEKEQWEPAGQTEIILRLLEGGDDEATIANLMGMKVKTIQEKVRASSRYKDYLKKHAKTEVSVGSGKIGRNFGVFEEVERRPALRKIIESHPERAKQFQKMVADGKFPNNVRDVRKLDRAVKADPNVFDELADSKVRVDDVLKKAMRSNPAKQHKSLWNAMSVCTKALRKFSMAQIAEIAHDPKKRELFEALGEAYEVASEQIRTASRKKAA